ncbi:3697_t:CDS:2 [Acaulospora colombiana]|uniref:3697_t:CDS:1 n=1 Tax=Acaulospora colombiana TaxID=27376 RepID=A0ACA9K3L8_9GLOM|nr:3697_t:CDS:2 [Acaulospora colombiana]
MGASAGKVDTSSIRREDICYNIEGFISCPYFNAATELGGKLKQPTSSTKPVVINVSGHLKEKWGERVKYLQSKIKNSDNHRTSPFVYEGCHEKDYKFIGGYTDFASFVRARYQNVEIPEVQVKGHGKEHGKEPVKECDDGTCKL